MRPSPIDKKRARLRHDRPARRPQTRPLAHIQAQTLTTTSSKTGQNYPKVSQTEALPVWSPATSGLVVGLRELRAPLGSVCGACGAQLEASAICAIAVQSSYWNTGLFVANFCDFLKKFGEILCKFLQTCAHLYNVFVHQMCINSMFIESDHSNIQSFSNFTRDETRLARSVVVSAGIE